MAVLAFPADILPLPEAGSDAANVDVAIAGAGPVGLFMGVLLKQAGVNVAIFDPHVLQGQGSKAAVTMPRSLEQLELAGLGASLVKLGQPFAQARMCLGGGAWAGQISGIGIMPELCRHVARTIGQNFVEEALAKRFKELGGRLYRACKFSGYVEVAGGLDVEVERSAYVRPPTTLAEMPQHLTAVPKTKVRAKYLLGCDGKQSAVRAAMGVPFEGHEYNERFLLCDIEVPQKQVVALGFDKQQFHIVLDATQGATVLLVHLQQQKWRSYFCQAGLTREHLTPEFMKARWRELLPPPGGFEPTEFKDMAFFEVSCKLASNFRKNRAFLAGDACHCHSPAGGQGMNTGLQDSANLAWKLAAVLKGQASESLLESYEAERRPIAKWVIDNSDVVFSSMATQRSACFAFVRRLILKLVLCCVASDKLPPAFLRGKMFGLSLTYAANNTCRNTGAGGASTLGAGDRLLDLPCREAAAAADAKAIYTLQLLNCAPHIALRLFLVAEASQAPTAQEVEACLEGFKPLLGLFPVVPVLYVASCTSGAQPPLQDLPHLSVAAATGFEPGRTLVPLSASATKDQPCAELCTRLGLARGGRALLVVRPDGYLAVSHRGSWQATPVLAALSELGLCGASG